MNDLIKVEQGVKGEPLVSARVLHGKLECGQDFTNWFKYQAEKLELVENEDFTPILAESTGGRPSKDYLVPMDIAKHVCMMSGGRNARELRTYFIEIEKAWNSPERIMARALFVAQETIEQLRPKAEYFDALVEHRLLTSFRDTAKELKVKERELINWLMKKEYIFRDGAGKLKPYAEHVPTLFEVKDWVNEKTGAKGVQTLVTPRGKETFRMLLLRLLYGKEKKAG